MFIAGREIANGFSELTDAAQQRARFEQDNRARRERGLPQLEIDERLLGALEAANGVLMFGLSAGTILSVMNVLFRRRKKFATIQEKLGQSA